MNTPERTPGHDIDAQFLERWSSRSFIPKPLPEGELMRLFEAARWAPSGSNLQPWRFIYAHRDSGDFPAFVGVLSAGNQVWAGNASVLMLAASVRVLENGREVVSHSFDTGAAWMSLALEAHRQGLAVHAMGGFDRARAAEVLTVPATWQPEAMIAVGYRGDAAALPEALQQREHPSPRNPLEGMIFQGRYPG